MGESALVESQLADAELLVRKLDEADMAPTLVVWYYYDDAGDWRLIIAGPKFDDFLPKQEAIAYRKVAEAMASVSPASLTLSDIKLLRSDVPLAKAIRMLIHTPSTGVVRAYFSNNSINGIFIKEMILLRAA